MVDYKNDPVECSCGAPAQEPHICPFMKDIGNSDMECTCCSNCVYQCCQDI